MAFPLEGFPVGLWISVESSGARHRCEEKETECGQQLMARVVHAYQRKDGFDRA